MLINSDDRLVFVDDHVVVHPQPALKDRVGFAIRARGGFLDVQPLAGRGIGAQVVFLPGMNQQHKMRFAVDLDRLNGGNARGAATLPLS